MADITPTWGRWAVRPVPPTPRSLAELVRAHTLDAELAATLWTLAEARVPIIVAALEQGVGKSTMLGAILDTLPPTVVQVELGGEDERFDWLPQASELGWARRPDATPRSGHQRAGTGPSIRPDTTMLIAPELSDHLPAYTWGAAARIAIRAASIGYGLAATIHADGLDEVFDLLAGPPVRATEDELSHLGVVLIMRRFGPHRRVVAAHYVRPISRDLHGHTQRLGPAVLATWDPTRDTFEQFGWAIVPELAARLGRPSGDVDQDIARRTELLEDLAGRGIVDVDRVRAAIAHDRHSHPTT